jgi:DNA (cytosine-5)-methyltransferase 1
MSARQAIEVPPIPGNAANHEFTRQSTQVVARLNALQPGENAFSENLATEHRLNIKGARISQIYKRLHPDQPAYTVTGSGGGGTHVYHWEEPRALTNRERARLQTFPDQYIFEGGKEAVRRQIGMAVPPRGAGEVFRALFLTLKGIDYPAVPASLGSKYAGLLAQLAAREP